MNDSAPERQLIAYNARDAEPFAECFSEDVVVEDGLGVRILAGRAQLRSRYAEMFAAYPNLHCNVVTRIHVGDYVIHEEHITGRSADTEHVVAIYRVEADSITHVRLLRPAPKSSSR